MIADESGAADDVEAQAPAVRERVHASDASHAERPLHEQPSRSPAVALRNVALGGLAYVLLITWINDSMANGCLPAPLFTSVRLVLLIILGVWAGLIAGPVLCLYLSMLVLVHFKVLTKESPAFTLACQLVDFIPEASASANLTFIVLAAICALDLAFQCGDLAVDVVFVAVITACEFYEGVDSMRAYLMRSIHHEGWWQTKRRVCRERFKLRREPFLEPEQAKEKVECRVRCLSAFSAALCCFVVVVWIVLRAIYA